MNWEKVKGEITSTACEAAPMDKGSGGFGRGQARHIRDLASCCGPRSHCSVLYAVVTSTQRNCDSWEKERESAWKFWEATRTRETKWEMVFWALQKCPSLDDNIDFTSFSFLTPPFVPTFFGMSNYITIIWLSHKKKHFDFVNKNGEDKLQHHFLVFLTAISFEYFWSSKAPFFYIFHFMFISITEKTILLYEILE